VGDESSYDGKTKPKLQLIPIDLQGGVAIHLLLGRSLALVQWRYFKHRVVNFVQK
jgi:hypothetical protein